MLRPIEIQGGYLQSLNMSNMQRSENNQVNVNYTHAEYQVKKETKEKTKKVVRTNEPTTISNSNKQVDSNEHNMKSKENKHIDVEV